MRALFVARFCGAISFLSSLPSSFCLSFSLSFVVVKKAPRPFCFFFDFFPSFGRDHGSVKRQSSPATGSKKKKSRRQLFRPRFQSAFVSSSTNPLVFGLCAEKFHRDEKNHILTHALQLQRKMSFAVSSFVGTRVVAKTNVRASSSSRRASSVQVFAERKLWWVRYFFFIRKSQAQARERAF